MEREEQEKAIEAILDYYRKLEDSASQDNVVTMLREIQEVCGCIPPDLQQRAADAAGVKLSAVTCIMKLYKSLKPAAYRHKLTVCTGPRCAAANGALLEAAKKELGTRSDGISSDGVFCLETSGCLKHCRTAPNVMIDGKLYPDMTEEKLVKLLREMK